MFPLSSYFSSKNAQGHLTACKLGGFLGWEASLNHSLHVMLLLYTSFLYARSSKDKVLSLRRKGTFCFSDYQMPVFHSINSLTDKFLCLCIQTSSFSGHFTISQWKRYIHTYGKAWGCSLLEFRHFLYFHFKLKCWSSLISKVLSLLCLFFFFSCLLIVWQDLKEKEGVNIKTKNREWQ